MAEWMESSGDIESIADALKEAERWSSVRAREWEWPDDVQQPNYTQPFGVWYRGQSRQWPLAPSVFREYGGRHYNESSLIYHFQARSPDFRLSHVSTFEWLCLMQHYATPTRLLDWTESVLVALYFAVERDPEDDGELYVLNTPLLNALSDVPRTDHRATVHISDAYNVVIRSLVALQRDISRVFTAREIHRADDSDKPNPNPLRKLRMMRSAGEFEKDLDDDVRDYLERLRRPVAVVPPRTNNRLLTQQGMFTIHGGKKFDDAVVDTPILRPFEFSDFAERAFLKRYRVPGGASKDAIRRQLKAAGIHQGALFPEIDQQSEYLRAIWLQ
ncbi:MAG TPA: FRG domain-containing protein [Longimicrobium sp.]|nr:FRG domain-containing protein [Longimicrobium sp.]